MRVRGLAQEGRFFSREAAHSNGTFKVLKVIGQTGAVKGSKIVIGQGARVN